MKNKKIIKSSIISLTVLVVCFIFCLINNFTIKNDYLNSSFFILGVLFTSVFTDGYLYGVLSATLSTFIVNFAFTEPYFNLDFSVAENIISSLILYIVALVTCTITSKLKYQESMKTKIETEIMRGNLLRAISHDLKTPLTTIYGSSSALLDDFDKYSREQKFKMLKGIKEDSHWLIRMVENLLSVTKLEDGNVKINKTETALDELIDSILIKFQKNYPDIEVSVDIPDELVSIPMDPMLIQQVVINILENAVQHAEGMTELSMKVFTISQKAIFEIRDNGCGIAPDKLKNIFLGNFSTDQSNKNGRVTNMGIGLSLCATIIKAHGGDIVAENIKTGGALFRFTLNMEKNEVEEDEQQQ
ncbi:MAG: DUF4118 domain-containing protein [Ruminococcaceae bacterium]|nr:DUF4118 domain-containing protein [Oscillospiraceae bacterium]